MALRSQIHHHKIASVLQVDISSHTDGLTHMMTDVTYSAGH